MGEVIISKVDTGDFSMKYCRFGNGKRNLVILPGMSIKSTADMGELLAPILSRFVEDFTIYLFDRRDNLGPCTIEDLANDTVAAMRCLGIEKASFYGASQGGMMLLTIAEDYPDMVEKAVVASSASRANELMKTSIGEWKRIAASKDAKSLAESFADMVYGQEALAQKRDAIIEMNIDAKDEEMERFVYLAEACFGFDRYEELTKITAPILLVASKGDKVLGWKASEEIAEKLAGLAKIKMYGEEFGHGVYDEAPDFFELMYEWLIEK